MNKQKGFAVIYALVGILVIIVVAGGGIYWTQKINKEPSTDRVVLHLKQLSDIEKIIDPKSSANPNQDETANPDPIGANWKTYTFDKYVTRYGAAYNISLKYPSEWWLREHDAGTSADISILSPDYQAPKTGAVEEVLNGARFELSVISNQKIVSQDSLDEWFASYFYDPVSKSVLYKAQKNDLDIGGLTMKGLVYETKILDGSVLAALFNKGADVYLFKVISKNNPLQYKDLFNQILSTFRFDSLP